MKRRTYVWVVIGFVLLVIVALGLRGQGDGALGDWLRSMHGR